MESPNRFRSAFNGFNREDVVNYIAYISNVHETQVNQLKSEAEALRQECQELRSLEAEAEQVQSLRDEIAALQVELVLRDARIAELEQAADQPQEEPERYTREDELNAYRRAERMERMAQERVNKMVDQASQTLADAVSVLDGSTAHLDELAEGVRVALVALEAAIGESQNAVARAAASIRTVRTETE